MATNQINRRKRRTSIWEACAEPRPPPDRRERRPARARTEVAQVLVALALARPAVVSRDRLIEQCWEGRIVGDDAINRCIRRASSSRARIFAPGPFTIETVPRVGYCHGRAPPEATMLGIRRETVAREDRLGRAACRLADRRHDGLFAGWSRLHPGQGGARLDRRAALPQSVGAETPISPQGVGEEILGQLSREPQFRIAGRRSSTEFGKDRRRPRSRSAAECRLCPGRQRSPPGRPSARQCRSRERKRRHAACGRTATTASSTTFSRSSSGSAARSPAHFGAS